MNELLLAGIAGLAGLYFFFFVVSFVFFSGIFRLREVLSGKPGTISLVKRTEPRRDGSGLCNAAAALEPACRRIRTNRSDCLPMR